MARSRSPYGVLGTGILFVLLVLFVYSVAEVLLLLFVALLFSLYLGAVTDFLQLRLRLPRWAGLLAALLLTQVAIALVGLLIIPPVLEQTQELIDVLPELMAAWEMNLFRLAARYPILEQMLPPGIAAGGYSDAALERLGTYLSGLFPYLFSGLHLVINLISVLVMGIYLTLRPALYREGLISLVPLRQRPLAREILAELANTLRSWIVGMIIAMVFLGVLTYLGLLLLDVPYALAFGVFTGVVVVVPFFGTLVSTLLPALFVLGSQGAVSAMLVILLGVVVHLIEANVVHPMVMERQVNLPPVLSILSVLIMAELLGLVGLLVAVPVLATVMVLVRRVYVQRLAVGKGLRRSGEERKRAAPPVPESMARPPVQPARRQPSTS